jgi:hypothetical protein
MQENKNKRGVENEVETLEKKIIFAHFKINLIK